LLDEKARLIPIVIFTKTSELLGLLLLLLLLERPNVLLGQVSKVSEGLPTQRVLSVVAIPSLVLPPSSIPEPEWRYGFFIIFIWVRRLEQEAL